MTYNPADYELEKGGSLYSYWEVFRYGDDGDYFELVDSPVPGYIGTRVVLKEAFGDGIVMKKAGTYDDDAANTLVIPYGALTAGKWGKLVKKKKRVRIHSLDETLLRIMDDEPVIVVDSHGDEYKVSKYTDFIDIDVYDFDDLSSLTFYVEV